MKQQTKACIFFIVIFLSFNVAHVILHEQTHKGIFNDFGINSTIHYGMIESYVASEPFADKECNRNCQISILQSQTEMISYCIDMLFVLMFIFIILFFTFKDMDE